MKPYIEDEPKGNIPRYVHPKHVIGTIPYFEFVDSAFFDFVIPRINNHDNQSNIWKELYSLFVDGAPLGLILESRSEYNKYGLYVKVDLLNKELETIKFKKGNTEYVIQRPNN